jgi:hypothetical protein
MRSTCTIKKEGNQCKLNGSDATNLVGTTSTTSFTQPVTLKKKRYSPPYNIFYAYPQGLHPNVIFPRDFQVQVPKLGLLLSQNFYHLYISHNFFRAYKGSILYPLKKSFPTLYNTP